MHWVSMEFKKITQLRNIREWAELDVQTVVKTGEDWDEFAIVIANIRQWEMALEEEGGKYIKMTQYLTWC